MSGKTRMFSPAKGESPDAPYFEETSDLIQESLQFNRNLTDSDFSIRQGGRIFTLSKTLDSERRFEEARASWKRPAFRTDPESVQKTLASRLVEANAQSKELEASSSAEEGLGTGAAQLLLCAAGVGLIGIVAFLKWRSG